VFNIHACLLGIQIVRTIGVNIHALLGILSGLAQTSHHK